jgi:glycerate kinase
MQIMIEEFSIDTASMKTSGRPMRILLAPNAFKGSLTSVQVAEIWEQALRTLPDVETLSRPLSDGGDGALAVWEQLSLSHEGSGGPHAGAMRVWFVARDPLGEPRRVPVLWDAVARAGFVETALASGLTLVAREARDPLNATTDGTGQLLMGLLELSAREMTLGLGGSATCDGGLGMARALGYRFLDAAGGEVRTPADLPRLEAVVSPDERPWESALVRALCDVRNPLLGPSGAARVFGPQKFRPEEPDPAFGVELLERGLERLADRVARDLGIELDGRPGRGAAGGLGAGLAAFAGAKLESGSQYFLEAAGVPELLRGPAGVDAVLTGEGSYDAQSAEGKIAGELAALCDAVRIPLLIVAGRAPGGRSQRVLTGDDIGFGAGRLDAQALAALAVEAVRRVHQSAAP